MKKHDTVISYGTFDLFHIGHVKLLRRLSKLGKKVVIGLSTDEFNALKGKRAIMSYKERKSILKSCRYVDRVFREETWEQKRNDVIREKADIFAMGDDWEGKFDDLGDLCSVIYLPRTENISTTELRQMVEEHERLKKAGLTIS